MNGELNPNHGVTQEVRNHWYKLCAMVLWKTGNVGIVLTVEDIKAFAASGKANISVRPDGSTITLSLVTDAEALLLAKREGGLPV